MKKRLLVITLVAVLLCLALSGCTDTLSAISTGNLSLTIDVVDGEAVLTGVPDKTVLNHIVIPDEYEGVPLTKVADFAAVNLENVTEITIGKNVKEIGLWAFENNQKVTAFHVDEENEYFCDVDGVLFTKDMKTLLFYPLARDVKVTKIDRYTETKELTYEIPDGVETIRTKAFYRCDALTNLTIPDSVKVIEEKVFMRCKFTSLKLPENLTFIGKDAFAYCSSLEEIVIPSKVTEIGDYAFYNCTNLKKVTVENKESDLILGEKWFPTNNGLDIDGLEIIFTK